MKKLLFILALALGINANASHKRVTIQHQ